MKKVISIFLLCALILSCFLGCSTPNAPVDENLPDEEGNSTPDDTTQEEIPDNVVNPMPDDDTDEKDPGNEGDSTPDDTDEKDPGSEGDSTPDDTDEKDPDNEEMEYVFVAVEGKGNLGPKYITCVEIPSEYETSNAEIPIILYYGVIKTTFVDTDRYPEIVVRAMNGEEQVILINRLDSEDILKPEYDVKCVWDEERTWVVGFMFAHMQTLTLPLSLFSGESGVVHIVLQECANFDSDNVVFGSGGCVNLYYTRNETTISIRAERLV